MFNNNAEVEIVDFRKEWKKRERKEAIRNGWNKFAGFIRGNQDVLMFSVPVALTMFTGVTKVTSRAIANHTLNKEIRFKECTIYDRSLGKYVELRKPLTAAQALTIEERRMNGEKLHIILDDMKLLRR